MLMSAPRLCSHSGCGRLDKHSHKSAYEERCEIGLRKEPLCRICKEVRGLVVAATTRDHIVPKAKGGSDDESNLQSLCRACNSAKGDRDNEEFRNSLEAAASRV